MMITFQSKLASIDPCAAACRQASKCLILFVALCISMETHAQVAPVAGENLAPLAKVSGSGKQPAQPWMA